MADDNLWNEALGDLTEFGTPRNADELKLKVIEIKALLAIGQELSGIREALESDDFE